MTDLIALYCQIDDFWQMFRETKRNNISSLQEQEKEVQMQNTPFQKDEPL